MCGSSGYMVVIPLETYIFLALLTRRQENSVSKGITTIYPIEPHKQCTFIPLLLSLLIWLILYAISIWPSLQENACSYGQNQCQSVLNVNMYKNKFNVGSCTSMSTESYATLIVKSMKSLDTIKTVSKVWKGDYHRILIVSLTLLLGILCRLLSILRQ